MATCLVLPAVTSGRTSTRVQSTQPVYDTLVWHDEFNGPAGSAPDSGKWTIKTGRPWNHSLNSYTERPVNVSMDGDGKLNLTARHESYTGSDGVTREYTSGAITTKGKYAPRYGRIESRIRVPAGRGFWPAFWAVKWPLGGEIDAMEVLGQSPATVYGHIHSLKVDGSVYSLGDSYRAPEPLSDGYHVYGVTWSPQEISWELDGVEYNSISVVDLPRDYEWGFTDPEWINLNLAVGGDWPLEPNSTTPFPARMKVDWVRVYQ